MTYRSQLRDELTSTETGRREWQQERSILDTTELICEMMYEQGLSRADLAKRLGKSKGYISKFLDGTTNMTIRTISDVFGCLGYEFHPTRKPIDTPRFGEISMSFSPPADIAEEECDIWVVDDLREPTISVGR
ncbi:helix-turn-helix domain-containing protein [Planctomicrobium sp. SH664]|uniref:helix-turn-helix domain-containing protein n=1 Tax=Planctomicrobium sp. SH664 TaxID=3448125 RepID=UPI003F5C28D3